MINEENNFKRVSGVIVDHTRAEFKQRCINTLGEINIHDTTRSISSSESQSFLAKANSIKNHNGRSDLEIKLHAKSLSIST